MISTTNAKSLMALVLGTLTSVSLMTGCSKAVGDSPEERRAYADQMGSETLERLYEEMPEAREQIADAPGYAVFSNVGTKIFLLATGNGYGYVQNNQNGDRSYMRMQEVGVGVGIGVRDFYAVMVFNRPSVRDDFVTNGWEWGGEAEASAKAGDTGGAAEAAGSTSDMTIYQMTDTGVALVASISGTKYWRDKRLYEEQEDEG